MQVAAFTAYQKKQHLIKNGLIVLEFYGLSQNIVSKLNKEYPIYLKSSNGKRVQLSIIETLIGEMRLTQVILKVTSELKAGETYVLQIDNLPKDEEKPERYNNSTNKWEKLTFKITDLVDDEIPTLNSIPTESKKTLMHYGCGPASWVYFSIEAKDKSELFVKASVKNKATGKTTTYILEIENGFVKIGHSMCSGAFRFDNSDSFEVSFQLVDQSGNKSNTSEFIPFTKPTKSTDEE